MFWLPFLLFSVVCQVGRTIVVKKVGDKINSVFATFGRFLFMPLFSGLFVLFSGFQVRDNWFWLFSILAGAIFGISMVSFSTSLVKNNASITVAFFRTNVILILFFETIFLKENFIWTQVLGVFITISSVIFITLNKDKKLNITESLKQFEYKSLIPAWLIFPIGNILQKKAVLLSNPATTTFINNCSSVFFTFLVLILLQKFTKSSKIKIQKEIRTYFKDFVLLGMIGFITVFAINFSTQYIAVTIAVAITQLEIVLTLFYAYFFLGEKDIIRKNILPILTLVAGIVLVVWK